MRFSSLLFVVAAATAAIGFASAANLRDGCSTLSDCSGIAYANCTDGRCVCLADYMPNLNGTVCHHKSQAHNATCLNNDECQKALGMKAACLVSPAVNDTLTRCLCMVGNHFDTQSSSCKRNLQLNDRCSGDVDGACYLTFDGNNQHVRCASNGTCACEDDYTPDYVTMKCSIGKVCSSEADCSEFVNAECASTGRCSCRAGFDAITGVGTQGERRIYCAKELRSQCGSPTDCVQNAECRDGVCSCLRDYLPSVNGRRCHHKAEAYNAPCEQSYECSQVMGELSWCNWTAPASGQPAPSSGQCSCYPDAHYYNYTCYRSLAFGTRCLDNALGRCYMPGDGESQRTSCAANGTCACAEGYAPSADFMHCSSSAQHWAATSAVLFVLLICALM